MRARTQSIAIAGAAALAVCALPARAATSNPGEAAVTASAVTILTPGGDAVTVPSGGDRLVYPDAGGVLEVHGASQTAKPSPGVRPHGSAAADVQVGKLFGGEVRFTRVHAQAHAWTTSGGAPGSGAFTTIGSLSVLGKPVHPTPGAQVPLGGWGTLTVLSSGPADGDLKGGRGRYATALDVKLTSGHRGLPAGSEILIGVASAAIAMPPAPTPDGGGSNGSGGGTSGSGSGSGSSTGSGSGSSSGGGGGGSQSGGGGGSSSGGQSSSGTPPTGTQPSHGGNARRGTQQAPSPSTPKPAPRRHPRHRRPPAPPRRVVAHPVTLRGSVRTRIVAAAESQIGWPYVWGGESEAEGGFDCSGLVDYAFAAAGRALPGRPTADVLWRMSQPIRRAQLRRGDLVFLLDRDGYAYHVALYAGHGQVVVAAHHGAPVALRPLGRWDGYGRLWQRRSTRFPMRLLPPAHPGRPSGKRPPTPAARPAHRPPAIPAEPVVGLAILPSAPSPTPRHPRPRAAAVPTVGREDELPALADRPRLRAR